MEQNTQVDIEHKVYTYSSTINMDRNSCGLQRRLESREGRAHIFVKLAPTVDPLAMKALRVTVVVQLALNPAVEVIVILISVVARLVARAENFDTAPLVKIEYGARYRARHEVEQWSRYVVELDVHLNR